jgi:hypothetical protein
VTAPAVEQYVNRLHLKITGPAHDATVPLVLLGSVIPAGQPQSQEIFRVTGNSDPYVWRGTITPIVTDTFRLIIDASVNPVSLHAAQISEIELCPPAADQPTAR